MIFLVQWESNILHGETLKKEHINGCYFLQLSESDINSTFDALGDKIFIRNLLDHYKKQAMPPPLAAGAITVSYNYLNGMHMHF